MFEYHAWLAVQNSPAGDTQSDRDSAYERVDIRLNPLRSLPGLVDVRRVNGMTQVSLSGFTNHRAGGGQDAIDAFVDIGRLAPGSYGLMHLRDDEDPSGRTNEFQILAMRRGTVISESDRLLSPCEPCIEDADD